MASIAQIAVDLIANTASFQREFRRAAEKASSNMSLIRRETRAMRRSIDRARHSVTGLVAAYAGIQGIRELSRAVYDNTVLWQSMQYTLQAGGLTARDVSRQLQFLTNTSYQLGVSLKDTGSSFSRFVLTGRAAGISLKELDQDYKAIVEAMRVFHLQGQQATRSWLALTEVMSIGTLKSRQFTQQLGRDWPGIGALIAKTMYPGQHSLEQFREAMEKGAISSRSFMNAFQALMQTPAMQGALKQSTDSIQSAVGRLDTSFVKFFSEAQNPRALKGITTALDNFSKTLSSPEIKRGFDDLVTGLIRATDWATKGAAAFGKWLGAGGDSLTRMRSELTQINKQISDTQQYAKDHPFIAKLTGGQGATAAEVARLTKERDALAVRIRKSLYAQLATHTMLPPSTPDIYGAAANSAADQLTTISAGKYIAAAAAQTKRYGETWGKTNALMREANKTLADLVNNQNKFNKFSVIGARLGQVLQGTLTDAFMGINNDWKRTLERMAIEAAESFAFRYLAMNAGGPIGTLFSFLGFGGQGAKHRAMGGPVSANAPYWVGEKGPELIVPRGSGTVVPNDQLGGGVVVQQHLHFDATLESVDARIMQAAPHLAAATKAAIEKSRRRPTIA